MESINREMLSVSIPSNVTTTPSTTTDAEENMALPTQSATANKATSVVKSNAIATNNTTTSNSAALQSYQPEKTIRIHVNTTNQPRPAVFNYRQLYRRELKKLESNPQEVLKEEIGGADAENEEFFKDLLRKAESYAMVDEDDEDEGSDEDNAVTGSKKQIGNEYDYEDPFIDDSDMFLDESHEYAQPEFDGFFVYHGPLNDYDGAEEKKPTATKRKAPSKPKPTTSAANSSTNKRGSGGGSTSSSGTTSNSTEKSRKKTSDDNGTDEQSKKSSAISSAAGNLSKNKKPATSTDKTKTSNTSASTNSKKPSTASDQPAKKKKKLENGNEKDMVKANSPSASSYDEPSSQDKKKKSSAPSELKPLDPEVEVLMEKLRKDVLQENFENKAKFPLLLKPTVLEAGLIMLRKTKTIDDNLVFHLMPILPYNRFTLKKFLTTKSGQMRVDELQSEIDELIILLRKTIDRMMPEQRRLFAEKVAQEQATTSDTTEEELKPKFKCNDEVRKILYDIMQTEEQSIHVANQVALHKDNEKKPEGIVADGKARKLMYQRLLSCWPKDWMNSYEMSRQYSHYKTKTASSLEKKSSANSTSSTSIVGVGAGTSISSSSASTNNTSTGVTATPTTDNSNSTKKRKRTTPIIPISASLNTQTDINTQQPPVITIDTDDEEEEEERQQIWKPSPYNSMKIESLISKNKN